MSESEPLDLSGLRILVVEDSWQIGVAMTTLLKELGAEVSGPAASSSEAVILACEQPPDAALIDFELRGGEHADGLIELLRSLGIHVVVATGYTELPTLSRLGVTILQKPLSEATLIASLRPMMNRER